MILGIYGAGGLGREVFELVNQIDPQKTIWKTIIFIDDTKSDGYKLRDCDVKSFDNVCNNISKDEIEIVIAVGEPNNRYKLSETVTRFGYSLATLIHPNVHIPDSTKISNGDVICNQAVISCDVVIEDNVYIQPNVLIGHNTIIEKNSVISGLVHIAGNCHVGNNTYIGMNSCIKENITIGNNAIISMSSAVMKDIPDSVIAMGNPARPILKNIENRVFK